MDPLEKANKLKEAFEKELLIARGMHAHFRCGNETLADKYDREAKHIQRLIQVLDIFISSQNA